MIAERITLEPGKRSGQPCIRGLRLTVWDVLGWLAAGQTEQEILEDFPELEKVDFMAVDDFAAKLGRRVALPESNPASWLPLPDCVYAETHPTRPEGLSYRGDKRRSS